MNLLQPESLNIINEDPQRFIDLLKCPQNILESCNEYLDGKKLCIGTLLAMISGDDQAVSLLELAFKNGYKIRKSNQWSIISMVLGQTEATRFFDVLVNNGFDLSLKYHLDSYEGELVNGPFTLIEYCESIIKFLNKRGVKTLSTKYGVMTDLRRRYEFILHVIKTVKSSAQQDDAPEPRA